MKCMDAPWHSIFFYCCTTSCSNKSNNGEIKMSPLTSYESLIKTNWITCVTPNLFSMKYRNDYMKCLSAVLSNVFCQKEWTDSYTVCFWVKICEESMYQSYYRFFCDTEPWRDDLRKHLSHVFWWPITEYSEKNPESLAGTCSYFNPSWDICK